MHDYKCSALHQKSVFCGDYAVAKTVSGHAVAQAVSVCFSGHAVSQTLDVVLVAVLWLGRSVFFQYFRGVEVPVHSQVSPRNIFGGKSDTTPDSTPTLHVLLTVIIPRAAYL